MNKIILVFFSIVIGTLTKEIDVTIEIKNILKNSGDGYILFYNYKNSFENKIPVISIKFISKEDFYHAKIKVNEGDYVIYIYQDTNYNYRIDTNMLSIPKEPYAISNYSGNGFPKDFNKLKLLITETNNHFVFTLKKF